MGKSSLIFNGLQWKLFPREEFLHSCDCLVGGLRPTELLINFPDLYYPRVHTAPDMPGDRDRYRLSATLLLFLLAHLKMRRHRRKTLRGQGVSEARFSASSCTAGRPLQGCGEPWPSLHLSLRKGSLPDTKARMLSADFYKKMKLY